MFIRNLLIFTIGMVMSVSNIQSVEALSDPGVKLIILPEGTKKIESSTVINSSPEVVWKVITDYNKFTSFMPGVKSFNIIKTESTKNKLAEITIDLSVLSEPFNYKATVMEDLEKKTLVITRIAGDLKYYKLLYVLIPEKDGTKTNISYKLWIDKGKNFPGLIIDNFLKNSARKMLRAIEKESLKRSNEN